HGEHAGALHVLGAIAVTAERPEVALDYFRAAVGVEPENGRLHCDLATALRETGNMAEAIRHYRLAIALLPGLEMARSMLEKVLAAAGYQRVEDVPMDAGYIAALNTLGARVAGANPQLA